MNTVTHATSTPSLVNITLGIISAFLVVAVLTGFNRSFGLGARGAFWVLFVIGVTMCALGPLGQGAVLGWWNPRHIIGYILGGVALLLGAAMLFNVSLPLLDSPRLAVLALGVLMAAKIVVAFLYP